MVFLIVSGTFFFAEGHFFDIARHNNFMDKPVFDKGLQRAVKGNAVKFAQRSFNLVQVKGILMLPKNFKHTDSEGGDT